MDQQFKNISLPSFISNLAVTDFNLGEIPPEVTIRHIGDPFEEFYEDENNLGAMNEANNDSKDEHLKNHGDGINNGSGYIVRILMTRMKTMRMTTRMMKMMKKKMKMTTMITI